MPLIANKIIVGGKEINTEESKAPLVVQQTIESEKPKYEIIKNGDLVRHHNTKSEYLNDMTDFKKL
jgi:hypothetical protein